MQKLTNKKNEELKKMLFTKKKEFRSNAVSILLSVENLMTGKKLYKYEAVGNGRRRHYEEDKQTIVIIEICKLLNYKLKSGNDSPRGGKLGDYIEISRKKNEKQTKEIIEYLNNLKGEK